ncbi:hypothetical protein DMA12_34770 [Amycolatopsis balhimycina DSM 5908]|uniref:Uncharacterized protein n=1 Tax=Amycolatopsis balhimycina DSM 5908 TaxID=1081091 RepID=A0A428W4F8_AMYBA|nr:hypothetical protein [Amycolatopsis balhimycina]RSM37923.1 hypothetical protein DMA12_34770 [Amycolatopsis balhimycina DSM 5908]
MTSSRLGSPSNSAKSTRVCTSLSALGATAGGGRFRPEATIFANAQRLDNGSGASRPAAARSGPPWPGAINGGSRKYCPPCPNAQA